MRLGGISMGAGRGILSVVFRMGRFTNVCVRALVFRIEDLEEWVIRLLNLCRYGYGWTSLMFNC